MLARKMKIANTKQISGLSPLLVLDVISQCGPQFSAGLIDTVQIATRSECLKRADSDEKVGHRNFGQEY